MRQNSRAAFAKSKNGRVVINLPRNWFGGRQRTISIGLPDSPENMVQGNEIARQINNDWRLNIFDYSGQRYQISAPKVDTLYCENLQELWRKYCEYKRPNWKAKSIKFNEGALGHWMNKIPYDWHDALSVRAYLITNTTNYMAVAVLRGISLAINWGIRVGVIPDQKNPYARMGTDLKAKRPGAGRKGANALSESEQAELIKLFAESPRYSEFHNFAQFLFLTGCRPSEAVGITWGQVSPNYDRLTFDRSIVQIDSKFVHNQYSKTNRTREFPIANQLAKLLQSLGRKADSKLIFMVNDQPIDYHAKFYLAWKKLSLQALNRPSTPYNARDTFITRQIEHGIPIGLVAQWVDNSTVMIEQNYLDVAKTFKVLPQ
jgi:integrase